MVLSLFGGFFDFLLGKTEFGLNLMVVAHRISAPANSSAGLSSLQ